MKTIPVIPGLLLLAITSALPAREIPQVAPAKAGLSETKLAEVNRFMERQVADQKIAGGIVVIAHQDKVGFFQTYGSMDREANQPMRSDTIFRIYSMSKAITTAAALTLHDAGKLKLDDPVAKYIPSFANLKVAATNGLRAPNRPMTVKDLMLHTSGITYGAGPEALKTAWEQRQPMESSTLAEMAEKLSHVPLAFDPGSDWVYGASIDVLGRVIEVASGENLDVFLRQTIFQPLDMRDTGFSVPPEKLTRFAANYRRSTNGLVVIDAPAQSKYTKATSFFSGGGGLVSTARDYLRFLAMVEHGGQLDGKRILKKDTIKLMTNDQLPKEAFPIYFGAEKRPGTGFGLGFSVRTEITTWDSAGHVGEYGWGGAASTHYWVSPKDALIVITLEQIMPYQWDTEFGLKKTIYDAIQN